MKRISLIMMLLTIGLTSIGSADEPLKGNRAQAGKRAARAQQARRDPQQLVATMMQRFDKDGDQKLDQQELSALLTSIQQRRGQAAGGRPGGAKGEAANPAGARRRGNAGKRPGPAGNPGGERPKRPRAEVVQ